MHRQKLAEMKPMTHNHPTQPIFINKQKNEQMVEDRFTEIERENRILFEKITQIHLKVGGSQTSSLMNTIQGQISGTNLSKKMSNLIGAHSKEGQGNG